MLSGVYLLILQLFVCFRSPSFVFALASMGNILLFLLYYVIDELRWWDGEPFYFVGLSVPSTRPHGYFPLVKLHLPPPSNDIPNNVNRNVENNFPIDAAILS